MSVYVQEWGSGEQVAVLIHGLGNSSNSWWEVGPFLADRGYRVLAVDLPGHGKSDPLDHYGIEELVGAVLDAVPERPALAIGHSLGGLILAHAVESLRPAQAVYEDPAWSISPDPAVAQSFSATKEWSSADLEREHPRWSEQSRRHKLAALADWDTGILASLHTLPSAPVDSPAVPSLLVLADPSALIPPARAEKLRESGFEVVSVAGAGHVVHFDDPAGFLAVLPIAQNDPENAGTALDSTIG